APTMRCPITDTASNEIISPIQYANKYSTPSAGCTGSTVASTIKYVGEQLEKTGPSAAPTSMSPTKFCLVYPCASKRLPERLSDCAGANLSHSLGNKVTRPKIIKRPPETTFQNSCGTLISSVDAFRRMVKANTDAPSEAATTNARLKLLAHDTDPPTMTGNKGRVQGASTVRSPATKAMSSNAIT